MKPITCIAIFAAALLCTTAQADVPTLINYQGSLKDAAGLPLNAVVRMTFTFRDAPAGGNLLGAFSEEKNVAVTKGIFNVLIGGETLGGVPHGVFDAPDVYLCVKAGDQELLPRQRVVSVAYAFKSARADDAARLEGKSAAEFTTAAQLDAALAEHADSDAHDGRYYTKDESNARFSSALSATPLTAGITAPRQATPHIVPVYIDNFCDSYAGWTPVGTIKPTKAIDAVNYLSRDATIAQGMKVNKTAGTIMNELTYTLPAEQDWTNCRISLRFFVHEGAGSSSYSSFERIQLTVSAPDLNAGFRVYKFFGDASKHGPGWKELTFHITDAMAQSANFDTTRVRELRLSTRSYDASGTPAVTFDRLMVYRPMAGGQAASNLPIILLTFDDGSAGHYNVCAALSGRGMVGTAYVFGSGIGTTGYLTCPQLRLMQWAGHLIGNHTYSHWAADFADHPIADQIEDIRRSVAWMCDNGFSAGARFIAMPGNVLWQQQFEEWFGDFFYSIRGGYPNADTGASGFGIRCWQSDSRRLHVSTSALAPMIAKLRANDLIDGEIYVYNGHVFSAADWTDFITLLDELQAKRNAGALIIGTPADLIYRLGN